ncbi:ROK family protein, partial [Francisella tularensis]|uniref:ROK family protein n=1 Tax=Francisella tularensis TaxID=263 RepID=UPI002381BEE8
DILKRARNNDKDAINIYKQFGKQLGVAIKYIMYTLDPEVIIIAWSIISAREFFEKSMWDEIKTLYFTQSAKKIKIECSETEGDFQV